MKFIIDSIDLDEIRDIVDHYPISGVTSNPSIVKKTAPKDLFAHLKEIQDTLGPERSLHVQVIGNTSDQILKDAKKITDELGKSVYIKVPADYEGLRAIRILKEEGYNITATAIYTFLQACLALEARADYIAPYVNRIQNLGGDPFDLIYDLSVQIGNRDTQIVAASFKNLEQIKEAIVSGAQAVTVSPELLKKIVQEPNVLAAVSDFSNDWKSLYGTDHI